MHVYIPLPILFLTQLPDMTLRKASYSTAHVRDLQVPYLTMSYSFRFSSSCLFPEVGGGETDEQDDWTNGFKYVGTCGSDAEGGRRNVGVLHCGAGFCRSFQFCAQNTLHCVCSH